MFDKAKVQEYKNFYHQVFVSQRLLKEAFDIMGDLFGEVAKWENSEHFPVIEHIDTSDLDNACNELCIKLFGRPLYGDLDKDGEFLKLVEITPDDFSNVLEESRRKNQAISDQLKRLLGKE